jgi:hypothetical protein
MVAAEILTARRNKRQGVTDHQLLEHRQKAVALRRDIHDWTLLRPEFVPIAQSLDDTEGAGRSSTSAIQPWDVKLWLPSQLPPELRATGCSASLTAAEKTARTAMAVTALSQLRTNLRLRANALKGMRAHLFGTGEKAMTRARARVSGIQARIDKGRALYMRAYNALLQLDPTQQGYELLKPLTEADLLGPTREADEVELVRHGADLRAGLASTGTYIQSWIWRTHAATHAAASGDSTAEQEVFDAQLRTAWAKAHARSERWDEETALLVEEMKRTLTYLKWKAASWREHIEHIPQVVGNANDAVLTSGLEAYAEEQAAVSESIAREFAHKWAPIIFHQQLPTEWVTEWLPDGYTPPPTRRSRAKMPLSSLPAPVARPAPSPTPIVTTVVTASNLIESDEEDEEEGEEEWEDLEDDDDEADLANMDEYE